MSVLIVLHCVFLNGEYEPLGQADVTGDRDMILKRMTQNAGEDYSKSLRQRSWAALAILAIGLTGLGCYLWLVPGSGLSDHAQGLLPGRRLRDYRTGDWAC